MSHHHSADHTENTDDHFTQEFWDARYRSRTVWSGNPNPLLVEYAAGLTPGTVLDVGSGEGADAIWLASRGWQVTGADLSTVALEHAARNAAEAGEDIAGRITWQHADFLTWDPAPRRFDLVSAQFMHLPRPSLEALYRRLAAAVNPGGTLLVVSHHPADLDTSMGRPMAVDTFVTGEEMAAVLDPDAWASVVTAAPERMASDPEGRQVVIRDAVLRAVRRG
ncbi:class I SAM-dependent methyltransferase [Streptomyces sp. NPDC052069]|uniref:class I SAM-dependent methyltransferase n=1 Tax=Streptomyces sp. NPDC052069 TaxID=3154650 RepID=UPI003434CA16